MDYVPCPECGAFNPGFAKECQECHAAIPDEPAAPPSVPAIAMAPVDEPPPPEETEPAADAGPPPFDAAPDVLARIEQLETAIAESPKPTQQFLQLAQIYAAGKRPDLAVQTIERALELDPNNTYLRHRLAQVTGAPPPPPPVPTGAAAAPRPSPPRDASPRAAAPAASSPRASSGAYPAAYRPSAPPVRNMMQILTPQQTRLIAGAVAAIVLAVVAKVWLFPSTRRLVGGGEVSAYTPVWSPSGRHLAFLLEDASSSSLAIYDFGKGEHRVVARAGWGAASFTWSSDGTKLAFTGEEQGDTAVFVVDAAEGQPRRVARGSQPAWSSDGQTLLMVCEPEAPAFSGGDDESMSFSYASGGPRYCRVNVATGQADRLALEPRYDGALSVPHESLVYEHTSETADESAGQAASADFDSLVDNVVAGQATNLAEGSRDLNRELESRKYEERRKAAITSERLPYAADIVVAGLGSGQASLVTSDHQSAMPSWTADGMRIVFATNGPSGIDFCTIKPDGTDRQTVLSGVKGVDPSTVTVAPDGKHVFFVARVAGDEGLARLMTGESPADLHVATIGGKDIRRLENKHLFKQRYSVSPDGRKIVYEVRQDVKMTKGTWKTELWLMRR